MSTALEAREVHVRFGDRVVLEEMNFAVEEGEFHGIMGPNGAGKTTFFNVLTGPRQAEPGEGPDRRRRCDGNGPAQDRGAWRGAFIPDHDPVQRIYGARECRARPA